MHYIEKNGKKVGHTVANEVREIYDVSEHAVINAGETIGQGAKVVGKHVGKDFLAVVHSLESDGKKFVHFIEYKTKP